MNLQTITLIIILPIIALTLIVNILTLINLRELNKPRLHWIVGPSTIYRDGSSELDTSTSNQSLPPLEGSMEWKDLVGTSTDRVYKNGIHLLTN